MSNTMTIASLKPYFKFPFQGKWQDRFLVGAGLTFLSTMIPVIPSIFVFGYALRVMRQVIEGEEPSLPDWNDWGKLGMDGLRATLVSLVYLLPGTVIFMGGMAFYFVSILAMSAMEEAANPGPFIAFFIAGIATFFLSLAIGSLLMLLGAILMPLGLARLLVHDRLAAAFHLREIGSVLRANMLGYFIVWTLVLGLMSCLSFVIMLLYYSVCLCCLIQFAAAPVGFYLSLVSVALFGKVYRESTGEQVA
ncbi:MAG: DUF4013 domain-containing protein [Thermoflexales bacterium]|nr:DUF4013 domain-containing protein [Thermoflexales bacterium]